MNLKQGRKQRMLALAVGAAAIIAALLIVTWPEKPTDGTATSEHRPAQVALSAQQMSAAGISLRTAGPATIVRITAMTGEIRLNDDRTAHVVPRLAGVVESVHAGLGQAVKKGQVLAVLASTALSEQRSELLSAQKKLALATTTYEREKKLWEEKISAEQDYLLARQAMQEAQIAQDNARQKLSALGAPAAGSGTLNAYELRAPFDGVIVEKHLSLGESVKEDANIFTLSDLSTVWADIAVPARDLETVRVGGKATIKVDSSDTAAVGTITYVGALVGEQTRTAPARVVLANPALAWRPGLYVTVDIAASPVEAAVAVPAEAIQSFEGRPTVFVLTSGGFAARSVTLGSSDGRTTEIRDGLKAGSQYAATGTFVLKAELGKSRADESH